MSYKSFADEVSETIALEAAEQVALDLAAYDVEFDPDAAHAYSDTSSDSDDDAVFAMPTLRHGNVIALQENDDGELIKVELNADVLQSMQGYMTCVGTVDVSTDGRLGEVKDLRVLLDKPLANLDDLKPAPLPSYKEEDAHLLEKFKKDSEMLRAIMVTTHREDLALEDVDDDDENTESRASDETKAMQESLLASLDPKLAAQLVEDEKVARAQKAEEKRRMNERLARQERLKAEYDAMEKAAAARLEEKKASLAKQEAEAQALLKVIQEKQAVQEAERKKLQQERKEAKRIQHLLETKRSETVAMEAEDKRSYEVRRLVKARKRAAEMKIMLVADAESKAMSRALNAKNAARLLVMKQRETALMIKEDTRARELQRALIARRNASLVIERNKMEWEDQRSAKVNVIRARLKKEAHELHLRTLKKEKRLEEERKAREKRMKEERAELKRQADMWRAKKAEEERAAKQKIQREQMKQADVESMRLSLELRRVEAERQRVLAEEKRRAEEAERLRLEAEAKQRAVEEAKRREMARINATLDIQCWWRVMVAMRVTRQLRYVRDAPLHHAATIIQAHYRGHFCRRTMPYFRYLETKKMEYSMRRDLSASFIQSTWRGYRIRKKIKEIKAKATYNVEDGDEKYEGVSEQDFTFDDTLVQEEFKPYGESFTAKLAAEEEDRNLRTRSPPQQQEQEHQTLSNDNDTVASDAATATSLPPVDPKGQHVYLHRVEKDRLFAQGKNGKMGPAGAIPASSTDELPDEFRHLQGLPPSVREHVMRATKGMKVNNFVADSGQQDAPVAAKRDFGLPLNKATPKLNLKENAKHRGDVSGLPSARSDPGLNRISKSMQKALLDQKKSNIKQDWGFENEQTVVLMLKRQSRHKKKKAPLTAAEKFEKLKRKNQKRGIDTSSSRLNAVQEPSAVSSRPMLHKYLAKDKARTAQKKQAWLNPSAEDLQADERKNAVPVMQMGFEGDIQSVQQPQHGKLFVNERRSNQRGGSAPKKSKPKQRRQFPPL